jgi:hypothetical protein
VATGPESVESRYNAALAWEIPVLEIDDPARTREIATRCATALATPRPRHCTGLLQGFTVPAVG